MVSQWNMTILTITGTTNRLAVNGSYVNRWYAKDNRYIEFMDQFMMNRFNAEHRSYGCIHLGLG